MRIPATTSEMTRGCLTLARKKWRKRENATMSAAWTMNSARGLLRQAISVV